MPQAFGLALPSTWNVVSPDKQIKLWVFVQKFPTRDAFSDHPLHNCYLHPTSTHLDISTFLVIFLLFYFLKKTFIWIYYLNNIYLYLHTYYVFYLFMFITYVSVSPHIPLECSLHKDRDFDLFCLLFYLQDQEYCLAHDNVKWVFVDWINVATHRKKEQILYNFSYEVLLSQKGLPPFFL